MKIAVTCEHVLYRIGTGDYWTQGAPLSFWERYCEVFDELVIVVRVAQVREPPPGAEPLADPRVSVAPIPYYRGPVQFARRVLAVRRALRAAMESADAILMRVPSTLANIMAPTLWRRHRPYAVEVVGDSYDVFGPGVLRHPLRPLFRQWYARSQRLQCAHASAAAYVTQWRLQQRYPTATTAWQTHYSSLVLPDDVFVERPRARSDFAKPTFRLITIAKLARMYKGVDVLIDALARCIQRGLDLRLEIIGDGIFRQQLTKQAASRSLANRVHFHGHLASGRPVYDLLDGADLFVLPSLTEGLPRSMIEAMARALPCVGSTAGGIPELLPADLMVAPGDAPRLAAKIAEILADPARLAAMSARNRQHAENYRPEKIRARRVRLYEVLRQRTASWLLKSGQVSVERRGAALHVAANSPHDVISVPTRTLGPRVDNSDLLTCDQRQINEAA
jgi:glycosyltransferase involved in cell wall biosynthesis